MRKADLIKMLEAIPGNPDVVIWNGFVGDWMDISNKSVVHELVRETPEFVRDGINAQNARDGLPACTDAELKKAMTCREWGFPNEFVEESEFERWYGKRRKRVLILDAKHRGKSTWDRFGTINY